ncbi:patatin-like phospholipase family protein [Romboutsia sp. 13368]|uniref:patatin-like phospholipase family protein n=1 Tax=Romboutsia sp. 13368 TaxID=2708053 RepID=UPI0025CD46A6|nr:patatin-like phospholipase family protein [Romboutsia sp. 13368]
MDSTFNIISFDGGGIRGALSINLLEKIQTLNPNIVKNANMISGTSTGSLIALGLAYGISAEEISNFYSKENIEYIFDKSYSIISRPKYENDHLKEVLLSIFPEDLKLKDLGKLVIIPSFYLGDKYNSWKAMFYNNIPNSPTEDFRVIDVAMASSAAPVFFQSYESHIDGGIIATDPSLASIIYAIDEDLGKKIKDIRLLSFGTGYCYDSIKEDTSKWGAIDWVTSKDPDLPIITVTLEGISQVSQIFSKKLLDDNYYRINPRMDKDVGMDDVKELDYLNELVDKYDIKECTNWINNKWNKI